MKISIFSGRYMWIDLWIDLETFHKSPIFMGKSYVDKGILRRNMARIGILYHHIKPKERKAVIVLLEN